jgi:NAD-dependent dihydropyrimidine dehydrogenase PreA subunit
MRDTPCPQPAGIYRPRIDRDRCEGKAACVDVCPYDVFEIGTVPKAERRGISLIGRLNGFAHRWRQAFAVNADACHACGKCVTACPERAIGLERRGVGMPSA